VAGRYRSEGDYEQPSKRPFVVYLITKMLVQLTCVGFEKTLPGFDQQLPAKCSVFPLLFRSEHYQPLEISLTNVGYHYVKVGIFHIECCNDVAF
jgi:hypothetical protein